MIHRLLGKWVGFGSAFYPTIEPTRYREVLLFSEHEAKPMLQIEQKTWRIDADDAESLLHWEFGFMRILEDGTYQWTNSQNNGRLEVLQCAQLEANHPFKMRFISIGFMNDPRMVAAERTLEIVHNQLSYTLAMTTRTVAEHQIHLQAQLSRAD